MTQDTRIDQEAPAALVPLDSATRHLGGISTVTLYRLIGRGELVKVNIGRRAFVTAASLNALVGRLVGGAAS